MQDIYDIVKNLEGIYDSNTAFQVLKDFERVLDELDIYVYDRWDEGELAEGPNIERHWVSCKFMWDRSHMPDPMGGKRLLDYDCKVNYKKSSIIQARKIKKPDDIRPGTKKGKLDTKPVWLVEIQMPKKLIINIYGGDIEQITLPEKETQAQAPAPAAPGGLPPIPPAPPAAAGGTPPAPATTPTGALGGL